MLAMFVALSGGAYAAVVIPNHSVGTAQLRHRSVQWFDIASSSVGQRIIADNSVTYNKIAPHQIGHVRVAQNQIQWRVNGKCAGSHAVQSVTDTGNVTCVSTLPANYSTAGLSDPLTSNTAATMLASETLPVGSAYHLTSTPYVQVKGSGGTQNVTVTCELRAGSLSETRTATVALSAASEQQTASIPMSLNVPATTSATSAALGCVRSYDGTVAPTVQAAAGLDAIQNSTDIASTTPGTSSTAFTLTAPTPTTTTTSTTPTTTTGTTTTP